MLPQISDWKDLLWVCEAIDDDSGSFKYTDFATVQNDMVYYGQLKKRMVDISIQNVIDALTRIPDVDIFPPWLPEMPFTRAPEDLPPNIFIKRPNIELYDIYSEHGVVNLLPQGLVEEAEAMQVLLGKPHPNIITYYGCHVRRGYITGLVLDRHRHDLKNYLKNGHTIQDKDLFVKLLSSAIHHFHSLGWAHNDVNPGNVLVAENEVPILIDFGSARRIGEALSTSRGTKGWIDCAMADYNISEKRHDTSALIKLRTWLDNPTFEK